LLFCFFPFFQFLHLLLFYSLKSIMPAPRTIVVGGGLSGLSAAHTILERGGSVLVLDKQGFFGGNSTKATSGINGAATRAQASHDVKDSVKAFFDDTKKSAKDLARDDLIQVLAGNSASAVHWLEDEFGLNLSILGRLGGHSFERTPWRGWSVPRNANHLCSHDQVGKALRNHP